MNNFEFILIVQKTLNKLFGLDNVHKVSAQINGENKNKIYFVISMADKRFHSYIFYRTRLTTKDIRNILFAFKRNTIDSIRRGEINVSTNSTDEEIRTRVDK